MDKYTISILDNKIFSEILKEINIFSKFNIKHYESIDILTNRSKNEDEIFIFFTKNLSKNIFNNPKINKNPFILLLDFSDSNTYNVPETAASIILPLKILDLEKKIISLIAKIQFKKNSLIYLNDYILDKNERKIKKNDLELQLSEKEINFLILFSKKKEPISRNSVLTKVWNYSSETETHTVETHIHRLRKKILEKFGDRNFIKNNNKGYYI